MRKAEQEARKAEQEARLQAEQEARRKAFKYVRQTLVIRFGCELTQYDTQIEPLPLSALEHLNDLAFEVASLTAFEAELAKQHISAE